MRLGSKIFLTSALVIVVLAGAAILSLRAVGRLASVNREITTQTVPALRLAAGARGAPPRAPPRGARPRAAGRPLRDAVGRAGGAGGPGPRAPGRVRDDGAGGGPARRGAQGLRGLPERGRSGVGVRWARRRAPRPVV